MKVLLDSCVHGGAMGVIRTQGHDVTWAGEWPEDPGDDVILRRAHDESRILVTLDKDFGELAIVKGAPHAGIIRLVAISSKRQGDVVCDVLLRHGDEISHGAIATVTESRLRLRKS